MKTLNVRSTGGKPAKIPECVKKVYHMLCFNQDGLILAKINTCSCTECLERKFLDCSFERLVTRKSHLSGDETVMSVM